MKIPRHEKEIWSIIYSYMKKHPLLKLYPWARKILTTEFFGMESNLESTCQKWLLPPKVVGQSWGGRAF